MDKQVVFAEVQDKPVCVVWEDMVAVIKKVNLKRITARNMHEG